MSQVKLEQGLTEAGAGAADSTWTICAKNYLGEALRRKGKFEEAGKLLQESRDAFKRAMGTEHPETIATLADIGQVNFNMGNFDAAGDRTVCIAVLPGAV